MAGTGKTFQTPTIASAPPLARNQEPQNHTVSYQMLHLGLLRVIYANRSIDVTEGKGDDI